MMPSIWQLLILVAVVVLLFGTKKLRTLGSDLGASIKGFKKAINDDEDKKENSEDANFSESSDAKPNGVENNTNRDKKE